MELIFNRTSSTLFSLSHLVLKNLSKYMNLKPLLRVRRWSRMFSFTRTQNIKSKTGEKHLKVKWILEFQNKQTNKSTSELYTGITSGLFFPLYSATTVILFYCPCFNITTLQEDLMDTG